MRVILFLLGLSVALLGYYLVKWSYDWVREESGLPTRDEDVVAVPHYIIGGFERLLAFFLVALNVSGAFTILVAWMAAKLAANWQRRATPGDDDKKDQEVRASTLIALMHGVLSLAFGVLGGLIAQA